MANEPLIKTEGLACDLLATLEVDRESPPEGAVDSTFETNFSGAVIQGDRLRGKVLHGTVELKLGPGRNLVETRARLTILTHDGAELILDDRAEWRGKNDALVRLLTGQFLGVGEAYLVGIVTFEVSDSRYLWLQEANVLSHGTMVGNAVRIEFFQLTGLPGQPSGESLRTKEKRD